MTYKECSKQANKKRLLEMAPQYFEQRRVDSMLMVKLHLFLERHMPLFIYRFLSCGKPSASWSFLR